MNELFRTLKALKRDFEAISVSWALVGGLAVSARSISRYTGDVDVAVALDSDAAAEQLVGRLRQRGYEVVAQVENERTNRLGTVRLTAPSRVRSTLIIDLLFAAAGIESEAVRDSSALVVMQGLAIPVATVSALIVFKLISESLNRPQDASDLIALIRSSTTEDLARVRELAALATERGYSRERDLINSLEAFVAVAAES